MPNEKKTAEQEPRQEPLQESHPETEARARKRAPDQGVLPGIVGKQLRAAYGELLNSPIPDAFTELIKRLETQEPSGQSSGSSRKPPGEESSQ